ncbi:hypothetical protein A9Q99_02770 [Gammaproteobacteria bacterium 45_16_T64]|nr:hypothetical protein A9Q99_02770 [Gammaproteobacteria bacterium 45_16_T64]
MSRNNQQLLVALEKIEEEMVSACLWGKECPDEGAFASSLPFCMDTMAFEQWLQWLFVPRFRDMILAELVLPAESNIAPMAEESYKASSTDASALIVALRAFDRLVSES